MSWLRACTESSRRVCEAIAAGALPGLAGSNTETQWSLRLASLTQSFCSAGQGHPWEVTGTLSKRPVPPWCWGSSLLQSHSALHPLVLVRHKGPGQALF
jgi:hypothetical protein